MRRDMSLEKSRTKAEERTCSRREIELRIIIILSALTKIFICIQYCVKSHPALYVDYHIRGFNQKRLVLYF